MQVASLLVFREPLFVFLCLLGLQKFRILCLLLIRNNSSTIAIMSMLSKLRCITVDVTGTLIAYKGELGDYYCMAAKAVGLPCPDYKRMHESFKAAYTDMAKRHPCFGHAAKMPNPDWWRLCVKDSFIRAGYEYDDKTFEKMGTSKGFQSWNCQQCRISISRCNSSCLGTQSGIVGIEKPDPRIYEIALEMAGNIAPEEALHIGDSMHKDYIPSRSVGMSAMLLDRFKTSDAESWRDAGAVVLPDLVAVQELLTKEV
ncbi:haloacid dehalogenase-like hydrolase domain-containing protein 3 isoform X2 [Zingiber officinale]|uniref:haloacid dehalogenase-like hydrolase domain-containing protein 3 isoform X2 n=1 Tax=Zingiber officinale TaxID=94328 RepID=UPI001C4D15AE|nr:haloacid dehalogenase-like hydrolase domain-containing protein 3 isoform X2 [Zingiber officinale]